MRIAVISDVHGNAHALEAVLADIARQGVDMSIDLGDHLSGPFEAGRAADMLMAAQMPSIKGNHDRWLLEPANGMSRHLEELSLPKLSQIHLDWLGAMPETLVVADDVFMCHGIPTSDTQGWLDDFDDSGNVVGQDIERIESFATNVDFPIMLCGHTHVGRIVRLRDGRMVINPGSVGYPGFKFYSNGKQFQFSAGAPHARYALLEKHAGLWSASLHAVPYDFEAAALLAETAGMGEIAAAVRTGWVPR